MKKIFFVLAFIFINSCVFAKSYIKSPELESFIINDVTKRITQDYPAPNTVFIINPKDNLSLALSQSLRNKGYAISDNDTDNHVRIILGEDLKQNLRENGYIESNENIKNNLRLNINLDQVYKDLFRVTYIVNSSVFSRAYVLGPDHEILPASNWSVNRK